MEQEGVILSGRYQLGKRIGEGGMGEVYRATDLRTGRDVAVKMLHAKLCEREQSRKRFAREAQAAKMLDHPSIVKVISLGEYEARPFIVMELLDGMPLRKYVHRCKPTYEQLLSLTVELCDALYHAHCRGVIHRDLKPDNIFVSSQGHIKILDFGLARLSFNPELTALTKSGTALGTCSYMAPEQATGKEADQRSDLYSVGVILYEFFCGLTPFSADDPASVLYMQVHQEPTRPTKENPELPLEIEALILWLMNKNPKWRPSDAMILKEKIKQIIRLLRGGAVHYINDTGEEDSAEFSDSEVTAASGPTTEQSAVPTVPPEQSEEPAPAPLLYEEPAQLPKPAPAVLSPAASAPPLLTAPASWTAGRDQQPEGARLRRGTGEVSRRTAHAESATPVMQPAEPRRLPPAINAPAAGRPHTEAPLKEVVFAAEHHSQPSQPPALRREPGNPEEEIFAQYRRQETVPLLNEAEEAQRRNAALPQERGDLLLPVPQNEGEHPRYASQEQQAACAQATVLVMHIENLLAVSGLDSIYKEIITDIGDAININGGILISDSNNIGPSGSSPRDKYFRGTGASFRRTVPGSASVREGLVQAVFMNYRAGTRAVMTANRARSILRQTRDKYNMPCEPSLSAGIFTDRIPAKFANGPFTTETLRELISSAGRIEGLARNFRPNETFICDDSIDPDCLRCRFLRSICVRNRVKPVSVNRVIELLQPG